MDKSALVSRLEAEARQIRRNVWRALRAGGGGHAGGSCSAADILAALYFHRLRVRPDEPDWPERDRFVLSKGHANAALGAVLAQAGFIADEVLDRFYGFESPFGMHPDIKMPGVEMCTGALGHGLAVALGMALGARIQRKPFHTFVMLGDGELHEGSNWEAAMSAAHYRLSNLTAIVDFNKICQSGRVDEIIGVDPLAEKWRAFGWEVREIDGHDMAQVVEALDSVPLDPERPTAIIAHTVKGKGVDFAENTYVWHSNSVNDEILAKALAQLAEPGAGGGS
ncbi:MAG TPA: transketolase [Burkholderiales bacterium]|jgi:transketolase|nr:transketolase [Burkholderiales bacterium]